MDSSIWVQGGKSDHTRITYLEIDKQKRPIFHNSFANKEIERKHKIQINELKHQGIRQPILLTQSSIPKDPIYQL